MAAELTPPWRPRRVSPPFVIQDPLLGYIRPTDVERRVIDSDVFQRQRGVKQMGTTHLVYPSGVQTRFVHALGNLHIIGRMFDAALGSATGETRSHFLHQCRDWLGLENTWDDDSVQALVAQIVRITGLCHDLGHFPMSHVVEYAFEEDELARAIFDGPGDLAYVAGERRLKLHEHATRRLIETNGEPGTPMFDLSHPLGLLLKRGVENVIVALDARKEGSAVHPAARALAELVSSEIDSDRAEYLVRDGQVSGAADGQYDLERLIDSYSLVRVADRRDQDCFFRPSARALAAIESFLVERVRTYAHLYYHNIGMLLDALIVRVLRTVFGREREKLLAEVAAAGANPNKLAEATSPALLHRLHYSAYGDPSGYTDDATLWEMFRKIVAALEELGAASSLGPLGRRLVVSLRILLRRRRHWVSVWKRPTQFHDLNTDARATLMAYANRGPHKFADVQALLNFVARDYRALTGYAIEAADVNILNWLVMRFRGTGAAMNALAEELAALLNAEETGSGKTYWVEIAERTRFDPLKEPQAYEIADDTGTGLVPLASLSPGTVRAVRSMWYEYIHVRMYVIADGELVADERNRLAEAARRLLPRALEAWFPTVSLTLQG